MARPRSLRFQGIRFFIVRLVLRVWGTLPCDVGVAENAGPEYKAQLGRPYCKGSKQGPRQYILDKTRPSRNFKPRMRSAGF